MTVRGYHYREWGCRAPALRRHKSVRPAVRRRLWPLGPDDAPEPAWFATGRTSPCCRYVLRLGPSGRGGVTRMESAPPAWKTRYDSRAVSGCRTCRRTAVLASGPGMPGVTASLHFGLSDRARNGHAWRGQGSDPSGLLLSTSAVSPLDPQDVEVGDSARGWLTPSASRPSELVRPARHRYASMHV
jgi:hypothetical protein